MKHQIIKTFLFLSVMNVHAMEESYDAMSSILKAAQQQKIKSLKNLLELGAQANSRDEKHATILHYVVGTRKFAEIMPTVLKKVADQSGETDAYKLSCVIETFLNSKDEAGQTPLHWAASAGNLLSWEQLLLYGAHLTSQDHDGSTPLYVLDDQALNDWEFDREKSKQFLEFITTPLGAHSLLRQHVQEAQARLWSALSILGQHARDAKTKAVPSKVLERVAYYMQADVAVSPWWGHFKQFSLEDLINKASFEVQAACIKAGYVDREQLLDALVARHVGFLEFIRILELKEGNTMFSMKLAQIDSNVECKALCRQKYGKLLDESV